MIDLDAPGAIRLGSDAVFAVSNAVGSAEYGGLLVKGAIDGGGRNLKKTGPGRLTLACAGAVAEAATVRSVTTTGVWAQALTNNLVCGDNSRSNVRLYRHRARFDGLEANCRYDYAVELKGGNVYSNSFRTAPGRDTPIRFVAYADSETKAIAGVSSAKPADWLGFSREEPAPEEPDDPPDPGTDEDETIVLLPGATTNLTTASAPLVAHLAYSAAECGAGRTLVTSDGELVLDGVFVDAGALDGASLAFGGGNTAIEATAGSVTVENGAHVGGLTAMDVAGDVAVVVRECARLSGWRWSGAVAEAATVRLSATGWNGATLLVSNATMVAEGCLVRAVDASATASVAIVDSVLETSYVTMPFALASGISVVIERSTYTDDMYWFSMTTALANAGADLKIGAGCVLTVANEGVIGFLADGVTAEADGPRTWRTVKSNGDFFSFALDLDHVVDPATITEEMVKVKAVRVVDEGLLLTAWIDGVSVGRNALPENLSQIFGAVGSETPVDDFSADKAICGNMKNNGDGTVSYTVEPRVRPEGAKPGAFFFRVTVAK